MNNLTDYIKQFDCEHGDFVVYNGFFYFEDGARRENNPHGPRCEPPQDEYERLKLVVFFWNCKLQLAIEEFHVLKQNLISTARANLNQKHLPDQQGPAMLNELRRKVKFLQGKLKMSEFLLEEATPEEIKKREQACSFACTESEKVLKELKKIEV